MYCNVLQIFFLGKVSGEAALYRNYYYYFLSYIMCHQSIVDKFLIVSWTNSLCYCGQIPCSIVDKFLVCGHVDMFVHKVL